MECHCHVCINFNHDQTEEKSVYFSRSIEYELWTDSSADEQTNELIEEDEEKETFANKGTALSRPHSLSGSLTSALKNTDSQQIFFTEVILFFLNILKLKEQENGNFYFLMQT